MKKKGGRKNILYLLLGFFVVKLFLRLFKSAKKEGDISRQGKKNIDCKNKNGRIKEFIHKEEDELKKFIFGRESFAEFFRHSGAFLKDFFIPHENNNHKPKVLRTGSLLSIAAAFLVIKLFFSIYLFFAFPDGAYMSENLALQVFELINEERVKNDLPKLERNPELIRAAQAKAQDMIDNNYFAHFGPDAKKPWEWIRRTEYDYIYAGENLAMNFNTAEAVHAALMKSESHKKNILSDKYSDVGLAMIRGVIDAKETNILVQTFAHARKTEDIEDIGILDIEDIEEIKEIEKLDIEEIKEIGEIEDDIGEAGEIREIGGINEDKGEIGEIEELDIDDSLESASTTEDVGGDILRSVAMQVREIDTGAEEEPAVMAERNYLEIDNNTLVSIKSAPDVIGAEATATHKKIKILNMVFVIFAGLIGVLLALNIFVRLKVQHKSVIVQTIFTIVFISGLFYIKWHYLEENLSDILLM